MTTSDFIRWRGADTAAHWRRSLFGSFVLDVPVVSRVVFGPRQLPPRSGLKTGAQSRRGLRPSFFLLMRLHRTAWTRVYFSIPFADERVARAMEPHAPSINKRFEIMNALANAGIQTGISIAPVIPGLNDEAMPELLDRARAAGARSATFSLLRLSGSVESVFLERVKDVFPDRFEKVANRLREVRGGRLSESAFFDRQHGTGTYWQMIERLFQLARRRAGFDGADDELIPDTFRRPGGMQTTLFDREEAG